MAAVDGLFKKRKTYIYITQIRNLLLIDSGQQGLSVSFSCATCCGRSPLLWRLGDLLQSAAGLLQLRQGVGWWKGRHGRVLDKRVPWVVATGVDATADAAAAPGVTSVGQRLGVQRAGLPQALSTVKDTTGEWGTMVGVGGCTRIRPSGCCGSSW